MSPVSVSALLTPFVLLACSGDPSEPRQGGSGEPEIEGYTFRYAPPANAPAISSMRLRGSFNDWGETVMAPQAGGWEATLALDSAVSHEYKFFINGAWVNDMCYDDTWGHPDRDHLVHLDADGCTSDGFNGRNAVLVLGEPALDLAHEPGDPAHVSIAGDRLSIRFTASRGQIEAASIITGSGSEPMHVQFTLGVRDFWRASLPEATSSYSIRVQTADGTQELGPYQAPVAPFRSVDWVGAGAGYQIFTERFWNGDPANDHHTLDTDEAAFVHPDVSVADPVLMEAWDAAPNASHCCHQYYGGDLQGIIDRLDHLDALGVSVLYLNPIFHAGSAHGYDIFDYLEVAPEFGTEAVLAALLDAAHARGMRVIWDFVPNHVGVGHAAFQDAALTGESSPYWDWFNFRVPAAQVQIGNGNHYDGWWGFGSLPELRTDNPEVFDHLIEVAEHWTEFGFDGIRVDVPNDIHNRSAFFPGLRQAVKTIDDEVYLVGEIWERDASWLQGDQFDALMNYAIGDGVVVRFAAGTLSASAAMQSMAQLYADYPEAAAAMLFNLAASHDTDRLLTKLGGGELGATPPAAAVARQRLAAAFLFALPGVPVTWQGDECAFLGTAGNAEHRARFPMQWEECDAAMLDHYATLGALKHALTALHSPVIRAHDAAGPVLSFLRGEPGQDEMLVVLNSSASVRSVPIPAGTWADVVTGEAMDGSVSIGAYGWRYLRRD